MAAFVMLRTDYVDAVFEGLRKYLQVNNPDGTLSFADVTQYTVKEGAFLGAKDINMMNTAMNLIMAALNNGTDLYEVFSDFFVEQQNLFEQTADGYNSEFEAYLANLRKSVEEQCAKLEQDYIDEITKFEGDQEISFNTWFEALKIQSENFEKTQEAVFNTWFSLIKDQLSSDAAGRLLQYIMAYGVCNTQVDVAEKEVSCDNFSAAKGSSIRIRFIADNSATTPLTDSDGDTLTDSDGNELFAIGDGNEIAENPSLNVNGTGAYPIYHHGIPVSALYLCLGRTYDFVFNGLQYEIVGDIGMTSAYKKDSEITLPSSGSYQIVFDHDTYDSCCGSYIYHTKTGKLMPIKDASDVVVTAEGMKISFKCEYNPVLHYTKLS